MRRVAEQAKAPEAPMKCFSNRVVEIALTIPSGRVTTYGAIARAAGGGSMASQSITTILAKAERAGQRGIPYHRIVYADGRIWITDASRTKRLALYKKEGIRIDARDRIVNFADVLVEF
jgi:methylated-DNA-protein-cysteine methyltransferase related protein